MAELRSFWFVEKLNLGEGESVRRPRRLPHADLERVTIDRTDLLGQADA